LPACPGFDKHDFRLMLPACPGFDKHDFRLMLPAWRKTSQAESTDNIVCADAVVNFGSVANN